MKLVGLLRQVLSDYKSNFILVAPQLLGVVAQYLLATVQKPLMILPSRPVSGVIVVFEFVSLFVNFLVFLGQVVMTRKVILTGRARLNDWWRGLEFLWRVLKISIIVVVTAGLFAALIAVAVNLYISSSNSILQVQAGSYSVIWGWVLTLIGPVVYVILYTCVAPAVLDNLNVGASICAALHAVRRGRKGFSVLVGLVCLMAAATIALADLGSWALVHNANIIENGLVLLSGALKVLVLPLFTLMVFRIYSESSFAGGIGFERPLGRGASKHCHSCESEIPNDAKYCPDCGAKQ